MHRLLTEQLSGTRFIAVSNREPYIHRFEGDNIECVQPASGLTMALDPIMRATGGTWIAHGSGDADRATVDLNSHIAVPPGDPSYTLRRVWLDKALEEQYYYGLSNEGLWPLCHVAFHRPVFRRSDWEAYRRANQVFADAVIEEAAGQPAIVFIQDYHLALLPRMLKERNPDLIVAQFWHIPWPNRETFRVFPWKEELLDGMLGNDLLAFHLNYHCSNFLDTVDRCIEARVDNEQSAIYRGGNMTRVRPFAISIDFEQHDQDAAAPQVDRHRHRWRKELKLGPESVLGIGIDRADYTKGIPERLCAVDRFLEDNPEYRGILTFLQVAVPTRTHIHDYQRLGSELAALAERINHRWSHGAWKPIVLHQQHLPQSELMALHRLAAFCMVTSLHDGMNLVAKEFVASRADCDAALILSTFTGAAREFTSAILVNPYSADHMADAIRQAVTMPVAERVQRMESLRSVVKSHNIFGWASGIVGALIEIRDLKQQSAPACLAMVSSL
ncbi:MAG: trehalose-6-phosphate synthase [Candidatus Solibacter sp.]